MLFLQCCKIVGDSFGGIKRSSKYSRINQDWVRFLVVSSQGWRSVTYYDELGVHPQATSKEIKSAFYKLSKAHHPDMNIDNPLSQDKFKIISEAYVVLGNPKQRIQYDKGVLGRNHSVAEREQATHKFEGEAFYESRGSGGRAVKERQGRNLDNWVRENRTNTFEHAQYIKKKLAHKNARNESVRQSLGGGGGPIHNNQQSNFSIKVIIFAFVLFFFIVQLIIW